MKINYNTSLRDFYDTEGYEAFEEMIKTEYGVKLVLDYVDSYISLYDESTRCEYTMEINVDFDNLATFEITYITNAIIKLLVYYDADVKGTVELPLEKLYKKSEALAMIKRRKVVTTTVTYKRCYKKEEVIVVRPKKSRIKSIIASLKYHLKAAFSEMSDSNIIEGEVI